MDTNRQLSTGSQGNLSSLGNQGTQVTQWFPWVLLLVWCLVGLWGHLRYVDDSAPYRLICLSYGGIPLLVLTLSLQGFFPRLLRDRPRLCRILGILLIVTFAPGYLLIFNTLGQRAGLIKRTISVQGQIAIRDVERGSLGILYTRRW